MESGPAIASCPLRHRTRYYDRENWLYYYGHRYYDPATTKWISKDPLGEAGGWNLTAFCDNDPINNYDPTGLSVFIDENDDKITLYFFVRFMEGSTKEGPKEHGEWQLGELCFAAKKYKEGFESWFNDCNQHAYKSKRVKAKLIWTTKGEEPKIHTTSYYTDNYYDTVHIRKAWSMRDNAGTWSWNPEPKVPYLFPYFRIGTVVHELLHLGAAGDEYNDTERLQGDRQRRFFDNWGFPVEVDSIMNNSRIGNIKPRHFSTILNDIDNLNPKSSTYKKRYNGGPIFDRTIFLRSYEPYFTPAGQRVKACLNYENETGRDYHIHKGSLDEVLKIIRMSEGKYECFKLLEN